MKFCEKCGSYMRATAKGYVCTKCGYEAPSEIVEIKQIQREETAPVDVADSSHDEHVKVNEPCPSCGNPEAFMVQSFFSGEHAGVRQERAIQRLTCTKCGHEWTKD